MGKGLASFIWRFVRPQRWIFFFILLLSLIWSVETVFWPYLFGRIVDTLTLHDANRSAVWPALKGLVLTGFVLWTVVETCFRTRNFLQAKAFPKLESDIRMAMFDHVQHHSPQYFNDHFAGSLSNKIGDMTTQVTQILTTLTMFFPVLVTCLGSIAIFSSVNPLFASILAVWLVVHFSICFAFTPKCSKYSDIHAESRSTLVGKIVDSFTNNFAINLFYRFSFERARIEIYQKDEREKNKESQWYVSYMFVCLSVMYLIGQISLMSFMIYYWSQGKISTGEIIQVFNTTWNVTFMMWVSGEMIPRFFQSIGIATQALSIMHHPQDVRDTPLSQPLLVKKGEIIFDNVSFHFGEKKLFQNKSVHIRGGEKVGLVGFSGAGKTTFAHLILRFFPLEKGQILIDGKNIAHATLESLRNQVALIPQDPLLFHRSLEENIHYGHLDASEEEVLQIAKLAHCDEFIRRRPQGYQTLVGERGTKLSGGERQRIAIARAMLTKARILILDEATSALDSVTESYIQDSLDKLMENRTTLVVAHRLSTLSKMDRILVFDQGKIVEEGSHAELISKGGHYAQMWNMQAGGFLPDSPVPC